MGTRSDQTNNKAQTIRTQQGWFLKDTIPPYKECVPPVLLHCPLPTAYIRLKASIFLRFSHELTNAAVHCMPRARNLICY